MKENFRAESLLRIRKVQEAAAASNIDALLIVSDVNLLYLCGAIFMGGLYVPAEGEPIAFVRKPKDFIESLPVKALSIRKIEEIPFLLETQQMPIARNIALEMGELPYNEIVREQHVFYSETKFHDATPIMRMVRMIKTDYEIAEIKRIAQIHVSLMEQVPTLYKVGMTDLAFQTEIEYLMRRMGSIGIYRNFGFNVDAYMGSLLSGPNADVPSPYDFALGGAGCTAALPMGCMGREMLRGESVMVDMAGNFGEFITDMTRTYAIGELPDEAYSLHELSCHLHREVMQAVKPGITTAAEVYEATVELARQSDAAQYLMGYSQQSKFVGHGFGRQINELPVLAARCNDILMPGMTIAYEPKFVLPEVGAVGIENSYLITSDGVELLTNMNEEIINLLN